MSKIKYFKHNDNIYVVEFNEKIGFFTANKHFEGPHCPMHEGYGTTFESAVCNIIDKDNGLSKEKHVMLEM